jgi:hypothetical protein
VQKTFSLARHLLDDTSHQTRPKIDAGDASLLMGIINYTILLAEKSAANNLLIS